MQRNRERSIQIFHPVPPSGWHKQGITMLQETLYSSIPSNAGNFRNQDFLYHNLPMHKLHTESDTNDLSICIQKHHMFSSVKMRMENMRHINIIMQESYRSFTSEEHTRVFIQKTSHKIFRRDIIVQ
jgi:hypothetical protein